MPSIRQRVCYAGGRKTFPEFVERVMLLRNTQYSIEKFHMKCCSSDANHINTWTSSAIAAGVRELNLSVYEGQMIQLPRQVLTCNILVVLKLSGSQILIKKCPACFPFLKTLHLCSVKYQNDVAVSQFISSCLVLENLLIRRSDPDNVMSFDIVSHTLKRLMVYFNTSYTGEYSQWFVALKLDTPQLQFLTIWGELIDMYYAKEMPSLHEANVHALSRSSGYDFISSLHNVKVFSLSTCSVLHHEPFLSFKTLHKFCNLTDLKVEAEFCMWGHLQVIFDTADNLKSLTYEERATSCRFVQHQQRIKMVEKPLLSRLSSVSLIGFHGGRCNIALVGYILKNAKLLIKMEIKCTCRTLEDKLNLLQEISDMPRVSPTCKIKFR